MALAGLYITAGYSGSRGGGKIIQPIMSRITGATKLTAKGVASITGSATSDTQGVPMMRFWADVDWLIRLDDSNTADTAFQHIIPAKTFIDLFVPDNCKVSGAPA